MTMGSYPHSRELRLIVGTLVAVILIFAICVI